MCLTVPVVDVTKSVTAPVPTARRSSLSFCRSGDVISLLQPFCRIFFLPAAVFLFVYVTFSEPLSSLFPKLIGRFGGV